MHEIQWKLLKQRNINVEKTRNKIHQTLTKTTTSNQAKGERESTICTSCVCGKKVYWKPFSINEAKVITKKQKKDEN